MLSIGQPVVCILSCTYARKPITQDCIQPRIVVEDLTFDVVSEHMWYRRRCQAVSEIEYVAVEM